MSLRTLISRRKVLITVIGVGLILFGGIVGANVFSLSKSKEQPSDRQRLITLYDRGEWTVFMSDAATLGAAFNENDIFIDPHDTVEPSLEEELVAPEYRVNIYRARPVVVVDGQVKVKVITPYQTAERIAQDAGIGLHVEDKATITRSNNLTAEGAGLQLTINRSTPIVLDLYGRKNEVRTQARTIKALLEEKNITLGERGRVSVSLQTAVTNGMEVRVWKEGVQTITVDEAIAFQVEQIYDADRLIGYKAVKTPGKNGVRAVNYEIEIKDGVELFRNEIARIDLKAPTKQVEIIGVKSFPNALTKSKGAQQFTDSKGVVHRETYYDLNMNVVMRACGQGGQYSVRFDGAKVDSDGYVIIAANYGNYPRCTVVETSLGPGKVYDTGGFALRHPHGFDLATDWTRADGI